MSKDMYEGHVLKLMSRNKGSLFKFCSGQAKIMLSKLNQNGKMAQVAIEPAYQFSKLL